MFILVKGTEFKSATLELLYLFKFIFFLILHTKSQFSLSPLLPLPPPCPYNPPPIHSSERISLLMGSQKAEGKEWEEKGRREEKEGGRRTQGNGKVHMGERTENQGKRNLD